MAKFRIMRLDGTCSDREIATGPVDQKLSASVGKRPAPNVHRDVATVQRLLNRFSPLQGGPVVPLKVDGIIGPLTQAAIDTFQNKRLAIGDGRVDPTGPTFRTLKENPGTLKPVVPAAFAHIPQVAAILSTTLGALQLVRSQLQFGGPSSLGFGKAAMAAINKHFHLDKHPDPLGAVNQIQKIYRRMQTVVGFQPKGFVLFRDDPIGDQLDAFAFAAAGGFDASESDDIEIDPALSVSARSIYLCPKLLSMDEETISYAIIHEMAHFVGPSFDPTGIHDFAYASRGTYASLSAIKAVGNADCYAQYCFQVINRPFNLREHTQNVQI